MVIVKFSVLIIHSFLKLDTAINMFNNVKDDLMIWDSKNAKNIK